MAHSHTGSVNGSAVQQLPTNGERVDPGGFKLRFCTVCASNNNRYVYTALCSIISDSATDLWNRT
jgi:hypothetical protein